MNHFQPRSANTQMPDARQVVTVALGDRSYDILIGPGLLDEAGAEIARRLPGIRASIVTDETVAGFHLARLEAALGAAGIETTAIVLAAGEKTKSFESLTRVVDDLLAARLERGDAVIALGGGVIGDLAGFAAAVTRRGMRLIQMPTSLLAQVDSSVGGKTGINSRHGKNLIGAFKQPEMVIADTALLDTLSRREFAAGYAEVVKYGLIDQPDFFAWLEANHAAIFAGSESRVAAIAESCRIKAAVVGGDEREEGNRAILNLGHTFGHALEAACGYDAARLVHGEAVSVGMVLAYRFSARLGLCAEADAARAEAHLAAVGLPTHMSDIPGERLSPAMLMRWIAQDKKVVRGRLTFILTRGIGRSFIANDVDPASVEAFLTEEQSR